METRLEEFIEEIRLLDCSIPSRYLVERLEALFYPPTPVQVNTKEQNIEFRRQWDARVDAAASML